MFAFLDDIHMHACFGDELHTRASIRIHGAKRKFGARARLVVIAVEVGGRWSEEAHSFLSQLAEARTRGENKLLGASDGVHCWPEQWQ